MTVYSCGHRGLRLPFGSTVQIAWGLVAWGLVGGAMVPYAHAATCIHPAGNLNWDPYGDINGSGAVNVADAVCGVLVALSLSSSGGLPACVSPTLVDIGADANCNGSSDISDVVIVVASAIGLPLSALVDGDSDGCPDACAPCVPPEGASCLLDGACAPDGALHPAVDCMACNPSTAVKEWTTAVDGSLCEGGEKICLGGVCTVATPAPPTAVVGEPGDGKVHVGFTAPASTGGSPITAYHVEVVGGGGSAQGAASPVTVDGLANGQPYAFRVRAENSAGYSAWSEPSAPVTPLMCLGEPDGAACNDGDACTQSDTCQAGTCTGSNPVVCTAQDQCHTAGTCDPQTGNCSNPAKANGSACNDGNACTQTDTCQAGTCTGSNPVVCMAQDQCHTAGTCDPQTGNCSNPVKANGSACSDGDACTSGDTCQSGVCASGSLVQCPAETVCAHAGVCNPGSGECQAAPKANGTACNDGNPCTQTDTCQSGTCVGANLITCSGSATACLNAPSCIPATGLCAPTPKADGTACDDGNFCTAATVCQSGVCGGGSGSTCPPVECRQPGVCDPLTGDCAYANAPNGTECDDGDVCTDGDSCFVGQCVAGDPVPCCDTSVTAQELTFQGGLIPETTIQAKIDNTVAGRIYATTVTNRVYRSDDWGQTWQMLCTAASLSSYGIMIQSPAADGTVYVTNHTQSFRVTDSNGAACPQIGDVWASYFFAGGLAVAPDGRLYRWSTTGLFYSDNRGVSWTQMPGYSLSLFRSLAVDPSDPSRIVSVHSQWNDSWASGIYSGTTLVDSSYSSYSHAILFHPGDSNWIFLGQGGRYSSNGGSTWTNSSAHQVYAIDDTGRGYRLASASGGAATQLSRSLNLTSASPTWTNVATIPEVWDSNYSMVDARGTAIVVAAKGKVMVSTNDGVSFEDRTPYRLNVPAPASSVAAAGGYVYATVDQGTILRSNNEGTTWELAQYLLPGTLSEYAHLELDVGNPDHVYVRNQRWGNNVSSAGVVVTLDGFDSHFVQQPQSNNHCCNSSGGLSILGVTDGDQYGYFTGSSFHVSYDGGLTFHKPSYNGLTYTANQRWYRGFWSPFEPRIAYYGYGDSLRKVHGTATDITSSLPFSNPAGMDFVRAPGGQWTMRVISNDGKLAESTNGTTFSLTAATGGLSGGANSRRILTTLDGRPEVIATALLPSANEIALSVNAGQSWSAISVPNCSVRAVALSRSRLFAACEQVGSPARMVNIDWLVGCGPEAANPPSAPTDVVAVPSGGGVSVSFTEPVDDGGSAVIGYEVSPMEGGPSGAGVESPIAVSPLRDGTWRFRVRARNAAGFGPLSAPSSPVEMSTTPAAVPPGPASQVTITPRSTTLSVGFANPATDGGAPVTTFDVNCTSTNGGAPLSGSVAGDPAVLANPTVNAAYTCSVQATNAAGVGPASVSGSTTVSSTLALTAEPLGPNFVDVPVAVAAIEIDPSNPSRLIALDRGGMVHESTNAGASWTRRCYVVWTTSVSGRIFISPTSGTAYVRYNTGLYRVENRGEGQCPQSGITLPSGYLNNTAFTPDGELAAWAPVGFVLSSDRGKSWRRLPELETSGQASLGFDPHGVMEVVSIHGNSASSGYPIGSGLYIGADRVPSQSTLSSTSLRVYFDPLAEGRVYLASGSTGSSTYFSTDAGVNWSTSNSSNGASALDAQGRGLRLQTSGSDVLLRRTTNPFVATPTWTTLYTFAGAVQGSGQVELVTRSTTIAVLYYGKLFVSTNDGTSFTERTVTNNRFVADSIASGGGNLYSAVWGGTIVRSTDGGASWQFMQNASAALMVGEGWLDPTPASSSTFYFRNEDWNSTYESGFASTSNGFGSLVANIPTGGSTSGANMYSWAGVSATSGTNPARYYWLGWDKAVRTANTGSTFEYKSTTGQPSSWFVWYPLPRAYVRPSSDDIVLYGTDDGKMWEYNYATNAASQDVTARLPFTTPAGMLMHLSGGTPTLRVIARDGKIASSTDGINFSLVATTGGLSSANRRLFAMVDSNPNIIATTPLMSGGNNSLALSFNGGTSWQTLHTGSCSPKSLAFSAQYIYITCSSPVSNPIHRIKYDTLAP